MKKNLIGRFGLWAAVMTLLVITACNRTSSKSNLPAGVHQVEVIQAVQTSKYTYLRVSEDKKEYWMAIEKEDIKTGEVLYYSQAYEMRDFYSRELDRTFPSVLFVQDPSGSPDHLAATGGAMPQADMQPKRPPVKKLENLKIEKANDGITLEELFKNRDKYNGQRVKVRGLVVKLNKQIMKRNWMHVQDGSAAGDDFDLTVTSPDLVSEGNVATFEGMISLKKDFGSGYFYEVIMEDATPSDVELYE